MGDDVDVLVLRVPREAIAYVKCVFESYEDVAVTRTLDRHAGIVALLVAPDFLATARAAVAALADDIGCVELPRPAGLTDVLADDPYAPRPEEDLR